MLNDSRKKRARKTKQELLDTLEDMIMVVHQIPDEYDYIFQPGKHLVFSFLRGMAQALGVVAGVVVLIPIVIWLLGKVALVPLVGDFAHQVQERMEMHQGR